MKKRDLELLKSKIEIAEQYVKEVGKPIQVSTVYKGVNIGVWKQNLRALDKQDRLNNIPQELRRRLEDIGFFEDNVKKRLKDEEKIKIFEEYLSKHPDANITFTTVDDDGTPIGKYLEWIIIKYNRQLRTGKELIKPEVLDYLKAKAFYNYRRDYEVIKFRRTFNCTYEVANQLKQKYGDFSSFIIAYKSNKVDKSDLISPILSKLRATGILVNADELSEQVRNGYLKLANDISKVPTEKNVLIDGKEYPYVPIFDRKRIDEVLKNVTNVQLEMIQNNYGLIEGKKVQNINVISKKENKTMATISARIKKGLETLRQSEIDITSEQLNLINKYVAKLELLKKDTEAVKYISEDSALEPELEKLIIDSLREKVESNINQKNKKLKSLYEYYFSEEYSVFAEQPTKSFFMSDAAESDRVFELNQYVEELPINEFIKHNLHDNGCNIIFDVVNLIINRKLNLTETKKLVKVLNLPISTYRKCKNREIAEMNSLLSKQYFEDKLNVDIENVGFNNRTIGILKRRNCNSFLDVVNLVNADVSKFNDEEYVKNVIMRLGKIEKIGQKTAEDIFDKLGELLKEKEIESNADLNINSKIENFDFNIRAYHVLKKCGYNTIKDILNFENCNNFNLSYDESIKLLESKLNACKNLGEKTCREIIEKIEPYIVEENKNKIQMDDENKKEEAIKRFKKNAKELVALDVSIQEARHNKDIETEIRKINQKNQLCKELER